MTLEPKTTGLLETYGCTNARQHVVHQNVVRMSFSDEISNKGFVIIQFLLPCTRRGLELSLLRLRPFAQTLSPYLVRLMFYIWVKSGERCVVGRKSAECG